MSDLQWEPLAEVHMSHMSSSKKCDFIFCLCSRVFIKNFSHIFASTMEREEISEIDDVFNETDCKEPSQFSFNVQRNTKSSTEENDADANSCYYSASASHTDNYCSTDEHDPMPSSAGPYYQHSHHHHAYTTAIHNPVVLHSSDSGADISEYNMEKNRIRLQSVDKDISQETHQSWHDYWSENGDRLIWASWLVNYSEYVTPEFREMAERKLSISHQEEFDDHTAVGENLTDEAKVEEDTNGGGATHISMVISPASQGASQMTEDGWNPLTPSSVEETWNHRSQIQFDNDNLLSPRCESVTSSIPLTINTTDSMTNVTHMTNSSYELTSSKLSSSTSSSISSSDMPSTSASSTSQSMSEEDLKTAFLDESAGVAAQDNEKDADSANWDILWELHYHEQYEIHFRQFVFNYPNNTNEEEEHSLTEMMAAQNRRQYYCRSSRTNSQEQDEQLLLPDDDGPSSFNRHRGSKKSKRARGRVEENNLPKLVANLKLKQAMDGGDSNNANGQDNAPVEYVKEDTSEMHAFGLPTSFGSGGTRRRVGSAGGGDQPPEDHRSKIPKTSHENDTEEPPNVEKIKSAFSLMGYSFDPTIEENADTQITGDVVYRKKHIRLHNRILKMKQSRQTPKHIFFPDDDGVPSSDSNIELPALHSSSDDDSHNAMPPARHSASSSIVASSVSMLKQAFLENDEEADELLQTDSLDLVDAADATANDAMLMDDKSQTKRERKRRRKIKLLGAGLPQEIANDKTLLKYWYKRFSLFSKFDEGIKLDRESWFSVTPEKAAAHTAQRCRCDVLIDAFCGAGGNTIQFAKTCAKVIAIDIDPKKIEMAKNNAKVYEVDDRIDFIVGDFLEMDLSQFKADIVFLSPPWGGPQYLKVDTYDLEKSLLPVAASVLMAKARQVTKNIAIFLPRNANSHQIAQLAGVGGSVEVEQNFLDRKLLALTAYYAGLVNE